MKKTILGLILSATMLFSATQLADTSNTLNVPSSIVIDLGTPINLRTTTVLGMYGWSLGNTTGSMCFVEIFNVPAVNVVLGVTTPVLIIPVGQHLTTTAAFALPIKSPGATNSLGDNGVSVAAVTSPGGNVTCDSGVSGSFVLTNN